MTIAAPATHRVAKPARLPGVISVGARRGWFEIRAFLRQRESVVFTLLFPIMLLVLFGTVFNRNITPGVTFIQYFVAGMIAAGILGSCFQSLAIQIPIERDSGTLKRLIGTPMPKSSYFVGKVILVLAVTAISDTLLLIVGMVFFDISLPGSADRWIALAWISSLGITACTLAGIAFSSVIPNGRSAPAVVSPVALLLQFTSGVFFVYDDLPPWLQQVAAILPLKWMCQGIRYVFLPDSFAASEPAGSWELGRIALVLGAWAIGGLAICVLTFRWHGRRER
jgi:ABC-2 type transport system permease protein